ncbi:hypothetical protein ACFL1A_01700 [Patescibacteria group bacterium]
MKINKHWIFFWTILIMASYACQLSLAEPQTTPPTPQIAPPTQPVAMLETQPQMTEKQALELLGYTDQHNMCLYSEGPRLRGADCMARGDNGEILLPYQSVGCIVDGNKVGNISPKATSSEMAYVECDKPLYEDAMIYIDETQIFAAAATLGPGTFGGWDSTWNFHERIWFQNDMFRILTQGVWAQVLGCHKAMEGWIPSSIPQYEYNGLPPVTNPETVNFRAYIRTSTGSGVWDTWTSGVNLTGVLSPGSVDMFRAVCPTY